MLRGVQEDASNHMALNRGSQTSNERKWGNFQPYVMEEDSENSVFLYLRKRRGKKRGKEANSQIFPSLWSTLNGGKKNNGPTHPLHSLPRFSPPVFFLPSCDPDTDTLEKDPNQVVFPSSFESKS